MLSFVSNLIKMGLLSKRMPDLPHLFLRPIRRIGFYSAHGYPLDLDNPRTFSEKVQARMMEPKDPMELVYCSKHLAPYYAKSLGGPDLKFIPRVAVFHKLTDRDIEDLPDQFVLKVSHGSGGNLIVHDKSKVDWPAAVRRFNRLAKRVRNARLERNPHATIIIEELVLDEDGNIPADYKFHCFNNPDTGEFRYILQWDLDRFGEHKQNLYDEEMNLLEFTWSGVGPDREISPPAPKNYETMVEISKRLSVDFDYIRIDLYNLNGDIYFGEFSLTHQGGLGPVDPPEWDRRLGDMWPMAKPNHRARFTRDL